MKGLFGGRGGGGGGGGTDLYFVPRNKGENLYLRTEI